MDKLQYCYCAMNLAFDELWCVKDPALFSPRQSYFQPVVHLLLPLLLSHTPSLRSCGQNARMVGHQDFRFRQLDTATGRKSGSVSVFEAEVLSSSELCSSLRFIVSFGPCLLPATCYHLLSSAFQHSKKAPPICASMHTTCTLNTNKIRLISKKQDYWAALYGQNFVDPWPSYTRAFWTSHPRFSPRLLL